MIKQIITLVLPALFLNSVGAAASTACNPQASPEIRNIENQEKQIASQLSTNETSLDKAKQIEGKTKGEYVKGDVAIRQWLKPDVARLVVDFINSAKKSPPYNQICNNGAVVNGQEVYVPVSWDGAFCGAITTNTSKQLNTGNVIPNPSAQLWTEATANGPDGKIICNNSQFFVREENVSKINESANGAKACAEAISKMTEEVEAYHSAREIAEDLRHRGDDLRSDFEELDQRHSEIVAKLCSGSGDSTATAIDKADFDKVLLSCKGNGSSSDLLFDNRLYIVAGGALGVDENAGADKSSHPELSKLTPLSISNLVFFKYSQDAGNTSSVHACAFKDLESERVIAEVRATMHAENASDPNCDPRALPTGTSAAQKITDASGKVVAEAFIRSDGDTTDIDIKALDVKTGKDPKALKISINPKMTTATITCPNGTKVSKAIGGSGEGDKKNGVAQ